ADAQAGQGFELRQPQDKVSVAAGETLTLICTMSGNGPAGGVKWLKGWGSGNETGYDQKAAKSGMQRPHICPASVHHLCALLQQSSKEDNEIHYADLQPLPTAPRHGRSPGAACSEYASVRVAAK
ncbi:PREDICTED: signal-regulatory protein beta-2-like, partial [Cariama cristata]|uniref:signal-regulatory protein beta-2-like n=1 Tax=Cariama cristata TaxID=54380 RepID=UPI0005207D76